MEPLKELTVEDLTPDERRKYDLRVRLYRELEMSNASGAFKRPWPSPETLLRTIFPRNRRYNKMSTTAVAKRDLA